MTGVATAIVATGAIGAKVQHDAAKDAASQAAAAAASGQAALGEATALGREDITAGYDEATQAYLDSIGGATELARAGLGTTEQYLSPYAQAGTSALQQQMDLMSSPLQVDYSTFAESPGQQFLRERQEQALLRNQAAIGGLGGGNVRTALQEQAYGIAAQQESDWYQRQMAERQQQLSNLYSVSGMGMTAGQNIASGSLQEQLNLAGLLERSGASLADLYAGKGTALGNVAIGAGTQQASLAQAAGEASVAGTLGQASSVQSGLQNLAFGLGTLYNPSSTASTASTAAAVPAATSVTTPTTPTYSRPTIMV